MDVLGANRLQRVVSSKQSCGFSTQACNGTCCRSYPRRPRLATGQIIRTSAGYTLRWRGIPTAQVSLRAVRQ